MKLLALSVVALLLPQEKNEAEELFKKMEEKLEKATTISVKVKGTMKAGDMSVEGDLIVGEGNRARSDMKLKSGDSTRAFSAVSDGDRTQVMPAGGAESLARIEVGTGHGRYSSIFAWASIVWKF